MDRKALRLVAGVVTSGALVGAMTGLGGPAAAAAVGPDVAISATVTPASGTVDDAFSYVYTVTNLGDATALRVRLDVSIDGYTSGPSAVVSSPFGCTTMNSGGRLPVRYFECQLGNLAPGASAARTFAFRFTQPGTFHRQGSAYDSQVNDANNGNNIADPVVTVAPGTGGGGGAGAGGLLGVLQALLDALLGGLHR